MGKYEVTVAEFSKFIESTGYQTQAEKDGKGGHTPQDGKYGPEFTWRTSTSAPAEKCPVVQVSWTDATEFCHWLSGLEGRLYRLPTEVEWEYSCRAGTTTRFSSGDHEDTLEGVANVADASYSASWPDSKRADITVTWDDGYPSVAPVGRFRPNAWSLHDMHGNVWEWCVDWFDAGAYARYKQGDLTPTSSGDDRIVRGGSWSDPRPHLFALRSSNRLHFTPDFRSSAVGFRVVCVGPELSLDSFPTDGTVEEKKRWIVAELRRLNPEFNGQVEFTTDGGSIVEVQMSNLKVTCIAPLSQLKRLRKLTIAGQPENPGRLSDLTPLRGLLLTELNVSYSQVSDLTPLAGMPLTVLCLCGSEVQDLSPLAGMQLTQLNAAGTPIEDFSPLAGMPLHTILIREVPGAYLAPLKDCPLKHVNCAFNPERDAAALRQIETLEILNNGPAKELLGR
jgi:formylglycine-generating enzyme required for sulfatase activity